MNHEEKHLSKRLHEDYGALVPSAELPARGGAARWAGVTVAIAAVIVAAATVGLVATRGSHHPTLTGTGSNSTSKASERHVIAPADFVASCERPLTTFARFWVLTSQGYADPTGTVRVAPITVPARSMYISGKDIGAGTLCVSAPAWTAPVTPIVAASSAASGVITYLGFYQSQIFGAVRPEVRSVRVTTGNLTQDFTVVGLQSTALRDLGSGWHAFNSPIGNGNGPSTEVLVRAFDGNGHLLETSEVTDTSGAQPGPSR